MNRLSAYETFNLYQGIRLHFTNPKYDFFKYNGKLRKSSIDFNSRKDRFQFQKLSRMVSADELRNFIAANYAYNDSIKWVGDLLTSTAETIYTDHKRRMESFSYIFQSEIDGLFDEGKNPFLIINGENPEILTQLYSKKISLETFIFLGKVGNFYDKFSTKLSDTFLWPTIRIKAEKFQPFVEYNRPKLIGIIKEKLAK